MADKLPPLIQELADRIGREEALEVARKLGGQKIYVPRDPRRTTKLVGLIGMRAVVALSEICPGDNPCIPMVSAVRRMAIGTDPRPAAAVARSFGCHIITVYRLRAKYRRARRRPRPV
jgi:hypothetical protein